MLQSWGGKENGFGLADCCTNKAMTAFPSSATTLHFEYYVENSEEKAGKKVQVGKESFCFQKWVFPGI